MTFPKIILDHIAVSATTLAEATEYCEAALGIPLRPGGRHDVFSTHNTLLGLSDGLYLEAIAADPDAPAPDRPRWFDLDHFSGPARLTNWICRTEDLDVTLSKLTEGAGQPVDLRRGDLRWRMAVPVSGRLPFDNMHPALIQWQSRQHPSQSLGDSGCKLRRLIIRHPEAKALHNLLADVFTDQRVVFETAPASLTAEFDTPNGTRVLE